MPKKLFFSCLFIIVISFLFLGIQTKWNSNPVVLKLDSYPITQQELTNCNNYLDEVIYNKCIQILALRKRLIKDISYKNIEKERITSNNNRRQAVQKGLPIYGPIELDSQLYYSSHISELKIALQHNIAISIKENDPAFLDFYEKNKETKYKNLDTIVADFSVVNGAEVLSTIEVTLDEYNARSMSESDQSLFDAMLLIQPGEIQHWVKENGIACQLSGKQRKNGRYFTIEDHFAAISTDYANQLLSDLIAYELKKMELVTIR